MTWEDFVHLQWRFSGHLNRRNEHCLTRVAEANGHIFVICSHTPTEEWKIEHPHARSYEHYLVDGVIYKTRAKFIKALEMIK